MIGDLALAGEHDQGRRLAHDLTNFVLHNTLGGEDDQGTRIPRNLLPAVSPSFFPDVAAACTAVGEFALAEETAHAAEDPNLQVQALARMTATAVDHGETLLARQWLASSAAIAHASQPSSKALASLATAYAVFGDVQKAESITHAILDPDIRAEMLVDLAERAVTTQEGIPEARRLVAYALAAGRWTAAIHLLGRLDTNALLRIALERLDAAASLAQPVSLQGPAKVS